MGLLILLIAAYLIIDFYNKKKFEKTTYFHDTKNGYWKTRNDLGKLGEYRIYAELSYLEQQGAKFLFNAYIPKGNGTTSEVDVILVCAYGLFVFESKNYSGWIFGSEKQKNWTQTLPTGKGRTRKEYFYNPITQNKTHIKYIRKYLGKDIPVWSVITFSERCTLKKIEVESPGVYVVKRNNISWVIKKISEQNGRLLTQEDVAAIYHQLYPLTQVTQEVKERHIENIRMHR